MLTRLFSAERRITFSATADQGVVSLGTFLTNLLLIRHLPPQVYGAYVVMYGVLVVAFAVHGCLVAVPMCIKAAAEPSQTRPYVSASAWFTLALAPVFGLVLLIVSWRLGDWRIGATAALALTAWLLQETFRRGLIARLRYTSCIAGDALTYLGQAGAVLWLMRSGRLSIPAVFLSFAVMASLGAVVQAMLTGIQRVARSTLREYGRQFWSLGRWMLSAGTALNLGNQIFPWTLAAAFGAAAAARYQAALTPLGAVHPLLFSIVNVVTPAVAGVRMQGTDAVYRVSRRYGVQFGLFAAPYLLLLAIAPTTVLGWFYGKGSPYLGLGNIVRLFVFAYGLQFVIAVMGGLLNGLEEARAASTALVASLLGTIAIGVPLCLMFGVTGAVIGFVMTAVLRLFMMRRAILRVPPAPPGPGQTVPGLILEPLVPVE